MRILHQGNRTAIELLWIQDTVNLVTDFIPALSNLESLIISDWEPREGEVLNLTNLRKLHTLTLAECGMTDFSNLNLPSSLEMLHIIDCDTLSNINGLLKIKELTGLSLSGCTALDEFTEVIDAKSLWWLSFPPLVSQKEFESIVNGLIKLEVVELLNCSEIENISPLKSLTDLKILTLDLPVEILSDLGELHQLELVILQADLFEKDPQWIGEVRTSLPNTKVVPGSGLCLGSGWLLMLLPLILISRFAFRQSR